jgi:hypothetical protein
MTPACLLILALAAADSPAERVASLAPALKSSQPT